MSCSQHSLSWIHRRLGDRRWRRGAVCGVPHPRPPFNSLRAVPKACCDTPGARGRPERRAGSPRLLQSHLPVDPVRTPQDRFGWRVGVAFAALEHGDSVDFSRPRTSTRDEGIPTWLNGAPRARSCRRPREYITARPAQTCDATLGPEAPFSAVEPSGSRHCRSRRRWARDDQGRLPITGRNRNPLRLASDN